MQPDRAQEIPATLIGPAPTVIRRQGLAWLEGPAAERRYVESELRIGRGEQNDLRLSDASVSRYHAFLRRIDGRYLLSDVGSQNGTLVNGKKVRTPTELQSGDRIRVGTTQFVFHVDAIAEALATPDAANTLTGAISEVYAEGELRIVTVLFLDLHGFTAMSENMQPDKVTELMNRCFEQLTATVARYGGYVDKYVGDAMMVLFGAPVAHADDAERAVRAALSLQDELVRVNQRLLRRSNITLQMRIGINTGEVLAGRVGSKQFGQYTVMGDPVNLASRLEHAARVGHVLVGEATHRLTRSVIRYVALPPMSIRGKTEPVQAYEVVGLHGLTTVAGAAMDSSFVGREQELAQLGSLIETSRLGFQSATITAPSGAGKSALLTELHRRQAGLARWAIVRCSEYDQQTPYLTLRRLTEQILRPQGSTREATSRSLVGSPGAHLAALAQLLSPNVEPTPTGAPEAGREVLVDAFTQLIVQHAVRDCLLLAIDGVQWIDAESLAVLEAVVPDLEDARVVLITSARPSWQHPWPNEVLSIHLGRLSREECARLIRYMLRSDAVAADTVDILARESDGNPLLLAEMLRSCVANGSLCELDGEWRLVRREAAAAGGNVDSLRSFVQARLDQLSPEERRVLQLAAVLNQSWTASLLAQVSETNLPIPDLLRLLAEREYLVQEIGDEEPGYSFAHAITQEVAYASLPHAERQRLHERVGRVLEEHFDPVRPNKNGLRQLIYHFVRGGNHERAAQYLTHAADAAVAFAEDVWAIGTLHMALENAQLVSDRARRRALELQIQERLGDALLRHSNFADAQVAFEAAFELETSAAGRARIQARLAEVARRQGNHARVLELTRTAPEESDQAASVRAALDASSGLSLAALGQLRDAQDCAARALQLADTPSAGSAHILALTATATVQRLHGELAQARALLENGLAAASYAHAGDAIESLRIELGVTCYTLGDAEAAVEAVETYLRPGAARGRREMAELPSLDDAAPVQVARRGDPRDSWIFANSELLLGRVLVEGDMQEQGLRYLQDALAHAQRIGAREMALVARVRLADAVLATGQAAEAVEMARGVCALAEALKLRPLACEAQAVLAVALVETGEQAEGSEVAREGVLRARTLRLPIHEAICRRALGVVLLRTANEVQGRRHLQAAAAALEATGARIEYARTLTLLEQLRS